jgi:ubiquinone/menaquinone biosynthesis C-methylase UbiE
VIGIDLSAYLIESARRLAEEERLAGQVEFRTGDTHSLEIPDREFDAVVAHTRLSHVDNPLLVVKEAARVVKSGGDEALISAVVANPRVMRQLPRLLRQADLELVTFFPYVLAEVGRADFWTSGLEAYRRLVPRSGLMTEEYANDWIAGLHQNSEEGVFFGASNFYGYIARRR